MSLSTYHYLKSGDCEIAHAASLPLTPVISRQSSVVRGRYDKKGILKRLMGLVYNPKGRYAMVELEQMVADVYMIDMC